jgi:hypothetical protein
MISSPVHPAHNGGLMVAKTLACENQTSVPIKVMNVSDKSRILKAGRVIAQAEAVDEVSEAETQPDTEQEVNQTIIL